MWFSPCLLATSRRHTIAEALHKQGEQIGVPHTCRVAPDAVHSGVSLDALEVVPSLAGVVQGLWNETVGALERVCGWLHKAQAVIDVSTSALQAVSASDAQGDLGTVVGARTVLQAARDQAANIKLATVPAAAVARALELLAWAERASAAVTSPPEYARLQALLQEHITAVSSPLLSSSPHSLHSLRTEPVVTARLAEVLRLRAGLAQTWLRDASPVFGSDPRAGRVPLSEVERLVAAPVHEAVVLPQLGQLKARAAEAAAWEAEWQALQADPSARQSPAWHDPRTLGAGDGKDVSGRIKALIKRVVGLVNKARSMRVQPPSEAAAAQLLQSTRWGDAPPGAQPYSRRLRHVVRPSCQLLHRTVGCGDCGHGQVRAAVLGGSP